MQSFQLKKMDKIPLKSSVTSNVLCVGGVDSHV